MASATCIISCSDNTLPPANSPSVSPAGDPPSESADSDTLFIDAMEEFLRHPSNAIFGSTAAFTAAIAEIESAENLDKIFLVPLRHKILDFGGVLRWAYFLYHGQIRAADEGAGFQGGPLSLPKAFEAISQVLDIDTQENVLEHFEDSEEEEDNHTNDSLRSAREVAFLGPM